MGCFYFFFLKLDTYIRLFKKVFNVMCSRNCQKLESRAPFIQKRKFPEKNFSRRWLTWFHSWKKITFISMYKIIEASSNLCRFYRKIKWLTELTDLDGFRLFWSLLTAFDNFKWFHESWKFYVFKTMQNSQRHLKHVEKASNYWNCDESERRWMTHNHNEYKWN
jgi:hypothetical protein